MATASNTVPPLSKALALKAKKELKEDPAHRNAHLTCFKRWIDTVPHLNFPLRDDVVLMAFLRHAKYDHLAAQARFDNFCTLRASNKLGVPAWFEYPPFGDQRIEIFLNSGAYVPLGYMEDGTFVTLIRLKNWDIDQLSRDEFFSIAYMSADRYMFDQAKQIGGFGMILDLDGMSSKQMMSLSDRKHNKFSTKIWQDGYPVRTKFLVYYMEPAILDAVIKMVELWLSDKIKQRIIRAKDDMKRAYKKVPGLKAVMPIEYGGNNDAINALIEEDTLGFRTFYSTWKTYPFSGIQVDESRRPENAKKYMRNYQDARGTLMGAQGTFISLDADE